MYWEIESNYIAPSPYQNKKEEKGIHQVLSKNLLPDLNMMRLAIVVDEDRWTFCCVNLDHIRDYQDIQIKEKYKYRIISAV